MDKEDQSVEDMMAQVQLLELQAKRMQKLVEQRKQERTDMEMENVRMERQLKYLAEMAKENEEVEAEYQREQAAKQPFSGRGFTLGAPSQTVDQVTPETPVRKVDPVSVDPNKPSGNIQVRLGDGSRVVVKLNTDHTVGHIKQEIMARKPEESRREFRLVSLGPPSKLLMDHSVIAEEGLLGSAVIQRFQ